mmetsp:Transcript_812/g.1541  ORF Transcript_812/g.1541 Transcript_812/m.1541 type:complete len:338 (-) Transcript_812:166-1179(-)
MYTPPPSETNHTSGALECHPNDNPALEDESPILEKEDPSPTTNNTESNKRTGSFLPSATGFSDESTEEDGFFIEDNQDDENDFNHQDAEKGDNDAAVAECKQQDEANCETTVLVTPPSPATSFPTRSILKADVDEEIPIRTNKNRWRKLPAPDMEYVKMKRIESLNSIASRNSTPDLTSLNGSDEPPQSPIKSPNKSSSSPKKSDAKVKFQHIVVREYQQTIGDNPSVGFGAPISLDWHYEEDEPLDVDLYEDNRGGRRNIRQMHMTDAQRKYIFIKLYGFSESEVKAAKKATKKVKSQREFSKMMHTSLQPLLELEEMRESAVRKFRRYRRRNTIA